MTASRTPTTKSLPTNLSSCFGVKIDMRLTSFGSMPRLSKMRVPILLSSRYVDSRPMQWMHGRPRKTQTCDAGLDMIWRCGWTGKRCLRLDCKRSSPCDGFDDQKETEKLARTIAFWHGAKLVTVTVDEGAQTVAARAGYGSWGHSPERYAADHWHEYVQAAQAMQERIAEEIEHRKWRRCLWSWLSARLSPRAYPFRG